MLPRLPSAYTLFTRLLTLRERLTTLFRRRRLLPDHKGRLDFEPLEVRLVPDGRPLPLPQIFVGADAGDTPRVRGYNADTGELLYSFDAYCSTFTGGVRLGTGDFTGDGIPDIVTAPGAEHDARIHVYDGKTGEQIDGPLGGFLAYGTCVTGGVFVAAADVDGDSHPDVITGAIHPGGPKVKVFSGVDGTLICSFFVPGEAFAGGITVAAADLTGDGQAEVMVGGSDNGWVRTYDPLTGEVIDGPLGSFQAFGTSYSGGVFIGADALAGDVDGDGVHDLALGSATGNARVRVLSGATGDPLYDFLPFGEGVTGGARVALLYADHDSHADLVVGTGPGNDDTVRVFSGATGEQLVTPVGEFAPFGAWDNGVFVAATNDPPNSDALVNTYTTGRQGLPAIAADADGDFVVAWYGLGPGGSPGLYARLYDDEGTPQGTEFLVASHSTGYPFTPAVAMDADGDFVVAWEKADQKKIFFRLYDEAGTAQTTATEVVSVFPTTGSVAAPSVAMDADGDFVIAWAQLGTNPTLTWEVNARLYDETGSPQTTAFQVNSTAASAQLAPSAAMDEDGNFVVAWQSQNQDGSGYGVYAQRFDATGAAQGTESRVNSTTSGDQYDPSAAMDPDGNFVVAWTGGGGQDGHGAGVYAQRYNATGAAQGTEFRVNTYTTNDQLAPSAAMDEDGDFVVAWASDGQDGSTYGIYAQRVTSGGVLQGPEFRVNTYTTTGQDAPAAAMDADGHFVIAWHGVGSPDPEGVYIRDIGPDLDGQALVAVEGLAYSGVVATVKGTRWSAGALEATIQWGDGTYSTGTLVTNSGTVQVTGSHTYGHEGVYALAVRVAPTATGVANYALGLAMVVDPNDDRRFETVVTATASGGAVLPDTVITSPDWFQGHVGATAGFTFTESVNEPDGSFTQTRSGSLVFTLSETGSDFPQPNSNLTVTQTVSSTRVETDRAPNLYGSTTETGSGTYTLTQTGTGADYTWAETGTAGSTRTETETVGDGTYTATLTRAATTSASGENDAPGDTITATWSGTESSTRREAGYHGPQAYTQTVTSSGSVSGSQDGGFTSQDYDRDETHTGTYTLTQSTSNSGGVGTQAGNGSYTQSLSADGDESSGSVSIVETDNRGYAGTATSTLSGVVTTATESRTGSDTTTTSGNQISGTFTLVGANTATATSTATTVNQGVTFTQRTNGTQTGTQTENGTTGSGSYTLTGTGSATATTTSTDVNQGVTTTGTLTQTQTQAATRTGDRSTGTYSLSETDTAASTSSGGWARSTTQTSGSVTGRHTLSQTGTGSGSSTATVGRTGSVASGSYSLHQTSSGGSSSGNTSTDDSDMSGSASATSAAHATVASDATASQTSTTDQTGNALSGSYSLHETSTSGSTEHATSTANSSYNAAGTTQTAYHIDRTTADQSGSTTGDRTGNEISGSYSIIHAVGGWTGTSYGTTTDTATVFVADGYYSSSSLLETSTAYRLGGSTYDENGNDVSGGFSSSQTESSTSTVYDTMTYNATTEWADETSASWNETSTATVNQTDAATTQESGNPYTGDFSMYQTATSGGTTKQRSTVSSHQEGADGASADASWFATSTNIQSSSWTDDHEGNTDSGSYSLFQSSGGYSTLIESGALTETQTEADGRYRSATQTGSSTGYQFGSQSVSQNGNAISRVYTLSNETTLSSSTLTASNTSSSTWSNAAGANRSDAATSSSTSKQYDSNTRSQTGDQYAGTYSLHQVGASSSTVIAANTSSDSWAGADGSSGEDTATANSSDYRYATATTDRDGNEISGIGSLHQVSTGSSTYIGSGTSSDTWVAANFDSRSDTATGSSTSYQFGNATTDATNTTASGYSLHYVSGGSSTVIGSGTSSDGWFLSEGSSGEDTATANSTSYQFGNYTRDYSNNATGSYTQTDLNSASSTYIASGSSSDSWTAANGSSRQDTATSGSTAKNYGTSTVNWNGQANGTYSLSDTGSSSSTYTGSGSSSDSWVNAAGTTGEDTATGGSTSYQFGSYTVSSTGTPTTNSAHQVSTGSSTYIASGTSSDSWAAANFSSRSDTATGNSTTYQFGSSTQDTTSTNTGNYSLHYVSGGSSTVIGSGTSSDGWIGSDDSFGSDTATGSSTTYQFGNYTQDHSRNASGSHTHTDLNSGSSTVIGSGTSSNSWTGANGDARDDTATSGSTAKNYGTSTVNWNQNSAGTYSVSDTGSSSATVTATNTWSDSWARADTSHGSDAATGGSTSYQFGSYTTNETGTPTASSYHQASGGSSTVIGVSTSSDSWAAANGSSGSDTATSNSTSYQFGSATEDKTSTKSGNYSYHYVSGGSSTAIGSGSSSNSWDNGDGATELDTATGNSTGYQFANYTQDYSNNASGSYTQTDRNSGSSTYISSGSSSDSWEEADDSHGQDTATNSSTTKQYGSSTVNWNGQANGTYSLSDTGSSSSTYIGSGTSSDTWEGGNGSSGADTATSGSTSYNFGNYTTNETGTPAHSSQYQTSGSSSTVIASSTSSDSWEGSSGRTGADTATANSTSYQFGNYTHSASDTASGSYLQTDQNSSSSTVIQSSTSSNSWAATSGGAGNTTATAGSTSCNFGSDTLTERGDRTGSYSLHQNDSWSSTVTAGSGSTATQTASGWSDTIVGGQTYTSRQSGTTTADRNGNESLGDYTVSERNTSGSTTTAVATDRGLATTSTTTQSGTATTSESGDTSSGDYTLSASWSSDSTTPVSGTDARGTFAGTSTAHAESTTTETGNRSDGTYTSVETWSGDDSSTVGGGNGTTTYTRTASASDSSTSTLVADTGSGDSSRTGTSEGSSTVNEEGSSPTTDYSLQQVEDHSADESAAWNDFTGVFTLTRSESSSSSLTQTGSEGTAHHYDLEKTEASQSESTRVGDDNTGDYTVAGTAGHTSTAVESITHGSYAATFTEILTDDNSFDEAGNVYSGEYELSETGETTADFLDDGTNAGGTFHVTEGSAGSYDRSKVGNHQTGGYSLDETSETDYSFTEAVTGTSPFTLTGHGTDEMTAEESGDDTTGAYSRTETGTDLYTLGETGGAGTATFTNSVTGTDGYATTETGNHGDQTYQRTTTGGGTWTRTATGGTLSSGSGTNGYTLTESGDPLAGHFSQSMAGTDRYDLVQKFDDVSNTGTGATPGNVTFHSHGLPFRDPGPVTFEGILKETLRRQPEYLLPMAQTDEARYRRLFADLSKAASDEWKRRQQAGLAVDDDNAVDAYVSAMRGVLENYFPVPQPFIPPVLVATAPMPHEKVAEEAPAPRVKPPAIDEAAERKKALIDRKADLLAALIQSEQIAKTSSNPNAQDSGASVRAAIRKELDEIDAVLQPGWSGDWSKPYDPHAVEDAIRRLTGRGPRVRDWNDDLNDVVYAVGDWLGDQFFGPDTNPNSVGAPEGAEGFAPFWAPARTAVNAWENGRYGSAIANGGLAILDFTLVRPLFRAGGNLVGRAFGLGGREAAELGPKALPPLPLFGRADPAWLHAVSPLTEAEVIQALKIAARDGSIEARATLELVERGKVRIVIYDNCVTDLRRAGYQPFGSNRIVLYADNIPRNPHAIAGVAGHETKHWLQKIPGAQHYHQGHEFEAMWTQMKIDPRYAYRTEEDIWNYIKSHSYYKTLPAPPPGWKPNVR